MRGSPGEISDKEVEEERRDASTRSTRAVQENNFFFKNKKKNFFKSLPAGGKVSGMVWV